MCTRTTLSLYSHLEYVVDGVTYMRMKFHVTGSKRKGTVFMDLKKVRGATETPSNLPPLDLPCPLSSHFSHPQNDQGKYECRFLYVELVGYPSGTIVLEDNR